METRKGLLPWKVTAENNIIVGLSAYSIKFSKAAQEPVLILRIPIHEIASLSYINDDQEHLLFLKAGDAQNVHCKCHVLCCRNMADAEDICTIFRQVLQIVYSKPPPHSSPAAAPVQRRQTSRKKLSKLLSPNESAEVIPENSSGSSPDESSSSDDYDDDDNNERSLSNKLIQEAKRTSRLSQVASLGEESDGSLEADEKSAEAVVQRYMERLNKHMGYQDIKKFASLLRQYREDNMHVTEFCGELQKLYGEDRKFLIPGMKSFIPEEDTHEFNEFLKSQGLEEITIAGHQDVDQMLASIDQEMGNVEQNFEHIDS